jgi:hypothetical protein
MTQLLPNGRQHFDDLLGRPLVGGRVYFYSVGTNTPKNTYQDPGETILHTNPVILDARGEATIYGSGNYRQVVRNALGALIWDQVVLDPAMDANNFIEGLGDPNDITKGDALIAVKQPFAGAAARTQHDKNADELSSADFGLLGDGSDEWEKIQAFCTAGAGRRIRFVMTQGGGVYGKSQPTRLFANTEVISDPGVVIRRLGTGQSWMFVNGVIGDVNYATAYNGDSNIRVYGNTFDLNGFPGQTAAAFVLGHSRGIKIIGNTFKNGYNSHNIEINASADAVIAENLFQDQAYSDTASSFEVINIDYASPAGFPGWGVYDNTPDNGIVVRDNVFRNVQGGVSSHSVPAGTEMHNNIQVKGNTFQNIGGRAVRAQGWNNSKITGNLFINIGQEAITVLTGNRNIITGNIILGASTLTNGQYSAIRLAGDDNMAGDNIIDNTGYANLYPYPYGVASGSRNIVNTKGAKAGSSFAAGGMIADSGTLTNRNGRTLIFSGDAIPPVTITLLDNINNYDHLEVITGQVSAYTAQSHILRPFAQGRWTTSDKIVIQTVGGITTGDILSMTSFSMLADAQHIRQIYGVIC